MPFSEKLGKVPLQCSLFPCNFRLSWEKLLPKSHPSPSFLCTHFCPPSASTPHCLDLHYPPVVLHLCHSICPHTSFQTGFCYFLLFIFFFFLVPCSCCFPHTHVSSASLSHLTLSINCPQSQRRLLQVPTALQIHQHRAQGCLQTKSSVKGSQRLAACGNIMRLPWLSSWSKTVFLMENQVVILF